MQEAQIKEGGSKVLGLAWAGNQGGKDGGAARPATLHPSSSSPTPSQAVSHLSDPPPHKTLLSLLSYSHRLRHTCWTPLHARPSSPSPSCSACNLCTGTSPLPPRQAASSSER